MRVNGDDNKDVVEAKKKLKKTQGLLADASEAIHERVPIMKPI